MKRKFLAAAVAMTPLLLALAGQSRAQVSITTSTSTPIATATADSGAPADIDITTAGSIGVTATTGGAAVTLNSNNSVSNAGSIGFTDINNATGVLIQGGHTGNFTNTGSITLTESYTAPADPNNDGLNTGDFASGGNRIGVLVTGTSPFTGNFIDTGTITVQGNSASSLTSTAGVLIDAPITGTFLMETQSGAVTSSTATVAAGSISVTGNNTVGLLVTPNGSIGGSVHLTGVTATGINARAVVINGDVGGFLDISGAVTATGYRSTARSTNPIVSELYTAAEMEQGGPAVTIGGSVAGGVIISAPPILLATPSTTTYVDADGNGITDDLQGTGAITSYGSSPALQIGAGSGKSITLGQYETGTPTDVAGNSIKGYGLIIQGSVSANGLFDQLTSPNLPGPVSATAIQIGGVIQGVTGAGQSGAVNVLGGLYNDGGIVANAYQANATAIHIGANATVPVIKNDGAIEAISTQVNSATTPTVVTPITGPSITVPTPVAVTVTAIQIDAGANVTTINNTSGITAELTGTGGVGGSAIAILDKSGTLANLMNSGSITAELVQTLDTALMPGTTTAIDMSAGKGPQTITQTVSPNASAAAYVSTNTYVIGAFVNYLGNIYIATAAAGAAYDPVDYPTYWREIGSASPTISGNILMGSGPDTLNIEGGTVLTNGGGTGLLAMGASTNTITVNSTSTSSTTVQGDITEQTGGSFTFNVGTGPTNSGQYSLLSDTNPIAVKAKSINVGATGILVIAVDPAHNTNTTFMTSGASTFASGAQIGLTMQSLQVPLTETYTVVKTTAGGTITAGTFGSGSLSDSPYLFTASPAFVISTPGGGSAVDLTVTRKTAAQLGFNNAEASALSSVLGSLPNDPSIQAAVLSQTTQAGLKSVYDQLLPNQGQGIFDALDSAVQKVASMTATTPDAGTRVAGTSLWLQEVNERVERSGTETLGSSAQLFGLVGGYEHMGAGGGAIGVTLAYFNAQEEVANAAPHENVVASMIEAGAYYRRTMGHLTLSARGAGGYSWFSSDRRFLEADAANTALASWGGYFVDAHASAAYEMKFGRFYARPELSVDYLHLDENAENEQGGGTGFDLNVAARSSTRLSGQAIMVLGRQYGGDTWLRPEIRFGYREILSGEVGDTVASFAGGAPFTLSPDNDKGGWAVIGFSIKGGTQYSYIALEGDAEFRSGEQEYDLRIAGRSMF